jgi:quercetin dioxygenase-like cupin family protein
LIGKDNSIIEDDRGRIIPVADGVFRSVMVIESKKGAVRANHYHKTDSHIMHILSGRARYVEAPLNGFAGVVVSRTVGPGDSIKTDALVLHAIEFLEDTVMVVCTENDRDYETYMSDIVRVKLL